MKSKNIIVSLLLMVQGVFASEQPCGNPMGCELVYVAQQKYLEINPTVASKLTKVSEINDPRIQLEVEALVNRIPNLCYHQDGQLLELKTNSKGESFIPFSQNPHYKVALGIIKRYNSPKGVQAAKNIVSQGKSLEYADVFDRNVEKMIEHQSCEMCCLDNKDSYLYLKSFTPEQLYGKFDFYKRKNNQQVGK